MHLLLDESSGSSRRSSQRRAAALFLVPLPVIRRKLQRYEAWLVDQLTGYEYGDPEFDHLTQELAALRVILTRLDDEPEPMPEGDDICHGKEVKG